MSDKSPAPAQTMGFWMALALVVGSMIGSGVFLLPASLAPLGWNSVLGWLVTIAGTLCMAAVFARLARAFPSAGGPYAFTREAFGRPPAFMVAWAYWISLWTGNAAIAIAAVSYLSRLVPGLADMASLGAVAIVWLLTAINLRGVRAVGGVQMVTTVLKLVPLVAVFGIAAVVLTTASPSPLAPFDAGDLSLGQVNTAAILALWAMLGIETATVPADKVRDPERTVPRATLIGTALAGAIYLFVCSAVVLMLPADQTAQSAAPFADFVARYVGGDWALLVAAAGAISALGALNGWILVQAEVPHAMAKDGVMPSPMARSSPTGAPVVAHLVSSGLLTAAVLLNYSRSMAGLFEFMILLSSAITLVMYVGVALAAARLIAGGRLVAGLGFRAIVLVAFVYSVWTVFGAGLEAVGWGAALVLAGLPLYLFMVKSGPAQQPAKETAVR